jgi:cytoskeletal protein RodZ
MARPAPNHPSARVRIATWRRRVFLGSLGMFVAAWVAVAALGRQAVSPASAGTSASSGTTTQAQSDTSATQPDSTQSDSSQFDSTQSSAPQDLSSATTSQS